MVAATLEGTLSGLGRAMMQWGPLPERDAKAIQPQAKTAGIGFVERRTLGKKLKETEIDEFAATTFCLTLLDLAALDAEHARRECIRDLRQSGLLKVWQGVTSLVEVDACTNE